jgi:hypothetical protein
MKTSTIKQQTPRQSARSLVFGAWCLFIVWSLMFGVSLASAQTTTNLISGQNSFAWDAVTQTTDGDAVSPKYELLLTNSVTTLVFTSSVPVLAIKPFIRDLSWNLIYEVKVRAVADNTPFGRIESPWSDSIYVRRANPGMSSPGHVRVD